MRNSATIENPPEVQTSSSNRNLGNDFFRSLSGKAIAALIPISRPMIYAAGAPIFVEGEASSGVYVVRRGEAKLLIHCTNGKSLILRIAGPGEILGLAPFLLETRHSSTGAALAATEASFIANSDFLSFLTQHAGARRYAAAQLGRDCNSTYSLLRSIGLSKSAPGKLARFLTDYAANVPSSDTAIRIRMPFTREEIAQTIGASRETVTRLLVSFKKQRIVEIHSSTLLVLNRAALDRIAVL